MMDKDVVVYNHSNAAYGLHSREEENIYEAVVSIGSTLPQDSSMEEDLNPAAAREVSVTVKRVRVNCYAIITILGLMMAVISLIVALVAISYAPGPIELNNQQGQLSSSSQEVESQINNLKEQIQLLNESCKTRIINLHLNNCNQMLNDSNQQIQMLQVQLNDSNQQILMLQAQLNNSKLLLQAQLNQQIQTLQAQLNNSKQLLQAQLNHSNQQIQILFQTDRNIIATLLGTISYPVSSCSDIPQYKPSGEYWIATDSTNSPVQVYCDMNRTSCNCNTAGGWMRVANLDMTDPNQNCPDGFRLVNRTTPPLRTCGKPGPGCVSTTYPTYGVEYSRVCGRVIGYQYKSTDAFELYLLYRGTSIDDNYVDGVSLTHGSLPRQHIWTFAGALDETRSNYLVCPCTRPDLTYSGVVPPFVGQDYFCETGSRQRFSNIFYPDDPLWDGQGCGGTSTCCEFNNPPWFCKELPQPTTDSIELRLCGDYNFSVEDSPIEIVDIYVQ